MSGDRNIKNFSNIVIHDLIDSCDLQKFSIISASKIF